MRLLILTQKVDKNDGILGFFHRWLEEFAKRCDSITVICLYQGESALPANVRILSLGKERRASRLSYLGNFYRYIWRERKNYDAVFVHMNVEYVVLGGWLWRLAGKKVGLWYTHKAVTWKLRLAELFSNFIFTASRESFNLKSSKAHIVGHGIDVENFSLKNFASAERDGFKIVSVGRISPIKNLSLLIKAVDLLVHEFGLKGFTLSLIGEAPNENGRQYEQSLKSEIKQLHLEPYVEWVGNIPNREMPAIYQRADASVNLCPTGGVDKAVLESMACGVAAIAYNKTFERIFGAHKEELILNEAQPKELADKILALSKLDWEKRAALGASLRQIVIAGYSLENLIMRMMNIYGDQK